MSNIQNINIDVYKGTREVYLEKFNIGNANENLQGNLIFTFKDEFVDGEGRLEYNQGSTLNYLPINKIENQYIIPIKSAITLAGKVWFQFVITQAGEYKITIDTTYKANTEYYSKTGNTYTLLIAGTDYIIGDAITGTIYILTNIPLFKSNKFYLFCGESLNAVTQAPEGYELWIERANQKLIQIDNLNITASKQGTTTTIIITNKQGVSSTILINDGNDGVGITSITKTSSGLVDTYLITYTNGNTYSFNLTNGTTFTPSVDAQGNISWTNDGGKTNPETQNIKGPQGPAGQGIPDRGTTGQVLGKKSNTDYDTEWKTLKTSDLTNDSNFVSDADYVHTDNNYTTLEKTKLAGLSNYDDTSVRSLIAEKQSINDNSLNTTAKTIVGGINEVNTKANTNASDIDTIEGKIPNQATSSNQLADKDFVNSSIGTNTANYIYKTVGEEKVPFDSVAELEAYSGTVTNNDYAFVTGTDEHGNTYFDRYKATVSENTITWGKEYRLNNSSFTAAQWASIQSGITALLVGQITTNQNAIAGIKDGTNIDSFSDVESALGNKEDKSNKVTSINSSSTNTQYPSAKAVYDLFTSIVDGDEVSY